MSHIDLVREGRSMQHGLGWMHLISDISANIYKKSRNILHTLNIISISIGRRKVL